jgi:undecaprenyl-diphosphatase
LLAALIFFRRELLGMLKACIAPVLDEASRRNRSMVLFLAVASLPGLAVGLAAHDLVEFYLRDLRVIAVTTTIFGLVLWWADVVGGKQRELTGMTLRSAVIIGLAQTLALVPGVSRSGITITTGRFLGFSQDAASRFSFLLAIPITAAAGAYGALRMATGEASIDWGVFGLAVVFAALAGWVCIAVFLALLQRIGLLPFVIYRLALGMVLLYVVL